MHNEHTFYECREECKYQREGRCLLERADMVSPVHGAICWEYLFEDEASIHR